MRFRLALAGSVLALLLTLAACGGTAGMAASPTATPRPTATATATPNPAGAISGDQLMYPGEGIPALDIYAINTTDSSTHFHVSIPTNTSNYTISGVVPGTYYVIAYIASGTPGEVPAGGYTAMVPCGLSASCNDHTLLPVTVHAGETVVHINPNDWYGGTYPAKPGA